MLYPTSSAPAAGFVEHSTTKSDWRLRLSVPRSRLSSLDGLRGVAAVVVLLHHSLLVVPALAAPYFGQPIEPGLPALLVTTPLHLLWAGTEAVYLFFILSGLVLGLSTDSRSFRWAAYFPSRMVRLYLPVIAAVALAVVVIAIVPRDGDHESVWLARPFDGYPLQAILTDVMLLGGTSTVVSPLWSLQWEVLFSLLLPLYIFVARRISAAVQIPVYLALATLGTYAGVAALKYLPMFGIGVALAAVWNRVGDRVGRMSRPVAVPVWTVVIAGSLVLTVSYWMVLPALGARMASTVTMPVTLLAVTALIIAAVHAGGLRAVLASRPVRFLGTISFSLYLVHEPLVIAIAELVDRPVLTVVWAVPISLAVAVAFHFAVERPSQRLAVAVRDSANRELVLAA